MALNFRATLVLAVIAGAIVLMVSTAFAQGNSGSKPGWGNGDTNHTHSGPPGGQSVRPGNGFGDKNHTHSGPPGHSVHP